MLQGKLTVTRVPGQSIVIGDNIVVNIVAISSAYRRAKVQVIAPSGVRIMRKELIEKEATRDNKLEERA